MAGTIRVVAQVDRFLGSGRVRAKQVTVPPMGTTLDECIAIADTRRALSGETEVWAVCEDEHGASDGVMVVCGMVYCAGEDYPEHAALKESEADVDSMGAFLDGLPKGFAVCRLDGADWRPVGDAEKVWLVGKVLGINPERLEQEKAAMLASLAGSGGR